MPENPEKQNLIPLPFGDGASEGVRESRRLFYRIGEAAKLAGVEPFVLRYWETEFPQIKPTKKTTGQRVYYEEDLPLLSLDDVKMGQVITNLIVNAVKFSPRGATVTVRVLREPRWVRIDVVDEGPGVNADESTHIFELFGQGPGGVGRSDAGVGIGLHLVKRISELHGGHVGVISQPGEGSTFWVRLPVPMARTLDAGQLDTAA